MSDAYIIHTYPCIKAQLDFVDELTQGLDKNTRHLFCHILVNHLINPWEATPVCSTLIDRKLKGASWEILERLELIKASKYSILKGLSRKFTLDARLLDKYIKLGELPLLEDIRTQRYNLITRRKSTKIKQSELTDNNGNAHSSLIVEAVKSIKYNCINLLDISNYLKRLEKRRDIIKANLEKFLDNERLQKKFEQVNGMYINDYSCFKSIIAQSPKELLKGIYCYYPAYRVQMSGRISSIGGMMQSCSKKMKAIAYKNINDLHNYDLKASQVSGLIQQFELAKLDASWLVHYRDTEIKEQYARQMGVSLDCWKSMLCSTIMGSFLPKNIKRALEKLESESSLAAILDYLNKEFKGDDSKSINALVEFNEIIAPLKKQIDLWHQWLLDVYVPQLGFKVRGKPDIYISNPTGTKLNVSKLQRENLPWKVKSVVAAFILQGQEAAFIHHLTVFSLKYDYEVIQNEHDGVVTIRSIPEEAILEAGLMSGLKYCKLPEKPFKS